MGDGIIGDGTTVVSWVRWRRGSFFERACISIRVGPLAFAILLLRRYLVSLDLKHVHNGPHPNNSQVSRSNTILRLRTICIHWSVSQTSSSSHMTIRTSTRSGLIFHQSGRSRNRPRYQSLRTMRFISSDITDISVITKNRNILYDVQCVFTDESGLHPKNVNLATHDSDLSRSRQQQIRTIYLWFT